MKNIKVIISLFLMLALPITTFAAPPKGHKPPPPHHHHHHHHDYYYSNNNARDAIFVLLGLSAITAVAIAASQSSKKKKEEKIVVEQHYEKVSQDLTLTQDQQDRVKKLFDTNREKLTPIRDEKALKTIALEQEMEKENPDQALVNKLENEISELSKNIYRTTQETKKELQTILTPAQYEAMEEMKL